MVVVGNVSVFASGFNNPRGLKFGPYGYLYVAEGGAGGSANS
jgi:glucose/arabinose dehydrogenase